MAIVCPIFIWQVWPFMPLKMCGRCIRITPRASHTEMVIITGRNEVVAKVIFLHLSVILFTGGSSLGRTPSARENPPGPARHPPPPRADTTPLAQTDPPPEADFSLWSMSGRYASYWNAFLFVIEFGNLCLGEILVWGISRVPTRPGKPGKMKVHLENLEISWNFEKFNKYHGKITWNLEKLGGY